MAVHSYSGHAVTLHYPDSDDFTTYLSEGDIYTSLDYLAPLVTADEAANASGAHNAHIANYHPELTVTLHGNGKWSMRRVLT
jgi:flavorubredoxin